MSVGKRSGLALALACLGLGLTAGTNAHAAPAEIVAADECCEFIDGPFEQPRGEVARFVNPVTADAFHNAYSIALGPDRRPLFFSGTIEPGKQAQVRGTQYLEAGRYPFYCTVHPATMTGELLVGDSGTAVRRPSVSLAIPAQRLATLVRKGTLDVMVSSRTGGSRGSLKVRVGKSKIRPFVFSGSDLPVGTTRVTFMIPAKVRRAIKGRRSVTVVADVNVQFGSPASKRRVIG